MAQANSPDISALAIGSLNSQVEHFSVRLQINEADVLKLLF